MGLVDAAKVLPIGKQTRRKPRRVGYHSSHVAIGHIDGRLKEAKLVGEITRELTAHCGGHPSAVQRHLPLHWLADHHFDQHPVLTDGEFDPVLTEEARNGFAWLRHVVNGVASG